MEWTYFYRWLHVQAGDVKTSKIHKETTWNNSTGKRYILYSAIQENVLDLIKQIFSENHKKEYNIMISYICTTKIYPKIYL